MINSIQYKARKVVNPPQKPIRRAASNEDDPSGELCFKITLRSPIIKHPNTFTRSA